MSALFLPICKFILVDLEFFGLGNIITQVVNKFSASLFTAFRSDDPESTLMFFAANLEFNFKHKRNYTLFLVNFSVALMAAASSALCFELPLPVATSSSSKRTATSKVFW